MFFLFNYLFLFLAWANLPSSLVPTKELLISPSSHSKINFYASGGDSFGGGDSVDLRRKTAWFYGEQAIDTCVQINETFGVDPLQATYQVQTAIGQWQKYFKAKQIGSELSKDEQVNTNFNLKAQCEGGEDLVIYLGTGPIFANLEDLRMRQTLSRPVAYVNKTHMSEDLKWGKGYIRFFEPWSYSSPSGGFPNWSLENAFYNLILHELGHVLGFTHKDHTVMTKNISLVHFFSSKPNTQALSIDGEAELFDCKACDSRYLPTSSNSKIKQVRITPDNNIFVELSSGEQEVRLDKTLSRQEEPHFLRFFPLKAKPQKIPYFYFVHFNGNHYTMDIEGTHLTLRHQGKILEKFKKAVSL